MALATPVNVSSVSRAAATGIVTVVTASAHGLAVNQGFSVQGTSDASVNVNDVVDTVPNATTFTYKTNVLTSLSLGAGGTCRPARRIVVLSTISREGNRVEASYLLWLTTRTPVVGNASSAWPGASAQELAALASGRTIEVARSWTYPSTLPLAQVQTVLEAEHASAQAYLAALTPQPWQYYGTSNDGFGWG